MSAGRLSALQTRILAALSRFDPPWVLVDTPHQLLVNKLCALLSRSEIRDLVDVEALLSSGGDLRRALEACPRQDAGFSPLTFAWSLRVLPLRPLAARLGTAEDQVVALERFRDQLVDRVLAEARPDGPLSPHPPAV